MEWNGYGSIAKLVDRGILKRIVFAAIQRDVDYNLGQRVDFHRRTQTSNEVKSTPSFGEDHAGSHDVRLEGVLVVFGVGEELIFYFPLEIVSRP